MFCYNRLFIKRPSSGDAEMLKINMDTFHVVCNISSEFNAIFSIPVLLQLTGKFILVITFTFDFVFSVVSPGHTFDDVRMPIIFRSVSELIKILIILSAPDIPSSQVSYILIHLFNDYSLD